MQSGEMKSLEKSCVSEKEKMNIEPSVAVRG
jgi:hypothetical protein